jgi:endoribonuclease Dicer
MIGYIQSRGRARKPNSKYVIMLAEEAHAERKRYESFVETEGALKDRALFTNESVEKNLDGEETPEEEDFDPRDFNLREIYHNPVTGATLTFDTSVVLLARYCSSMPHDRFTPALKPVYTTWSEGGLYHARVTLPPSLPIEPKYLNYETTEGRYTKREARRAAAYDAVCVLHVNLRIFDDNLLPITSKPGSYSDDADGNPLSDISMIPEVLDTAVVDPWQITEQLLLYRIRVDDSESCIGLVTSSHLTSAHIRSQFGSLSIAPATLLPFKSQEHRMTCEHMMASYTEFCLNYMITSRPRKGPLAAFIVPLSPESMMPDYEYMKKTPQNTGNHWMSERDNWDSFGGPQLAQCGQLIENTFQRSRPLVLLGVRQDLTVSSGLLDDVLVYGHRNLKHKPCLSSNEYLVQVRNLTRVVSTKYQLDDISCSKNSTSDSDPFYLPSSACSLLPVPHGIQLVYSCLPPLMQRITDLYRANKLVNAYHLDGVELSHVVEALTLPSSSAGFSNQRLETLGDAVLKVAVVVHVYHKFPNYHEGQLSALKTKSISNRTLLSRGSALELPSYMTVEVHNVRQWRFVRPEPTVSPDNPTVKRRIPRRSIQDCMESLLGAAFLSGGISLSLKVGTHLDLCFGGAMPWSERYETPPPKQPLPLFKQLETICNYHFRCSDLLREALTHSTFEALGMPSYQRLEFLGDGKFILQMHHAAFDTVTSYY